MAATAATTRFTNPPFDESAWRIVHGHPCVVESGARSRNGNLFLESIPYCFDGDDDRSVLVLSLRKKGAGRLRVVLVSAYSNQVIAERTLRAYGAISCVLRRPRHVYGRLRIRIFGEADDAGDSLEVSDLRVRAAPALLAQPEVSEGLETGAASLALPHWGVMRRWIHALCQRSAYWNSLVAAVEMYRGCEEVLSLPQYVTLCPTGQCNASCAFCSVTINRTGIIKKQLPMARIKRLVAPVRRTARLFGLEGNGEPSLYTEFGELMQLLSRDGVPYYLITNAERLTREHIELLLGTDADAINVSLNAATAATHRRVMKVKSFDAVVANLRRLIRWRGETAHPLISVSFVVTRDNVHEVADFLRFAEWDLRVDRILVRPLSEIANDAGNVEDLRSLVPYESEIHDMLDGVVDYLGSVPRRAEIQIRPEHFRAYRPDPAEGALEVPGYEGQLLPPRPAYWHVANSAKVDWRGREVTIQSTQPGLALASGYFAVRSASRLSLRCSVSVKIGRLTLVARNQDGTIMGEMSIDRIKSAATPIEVTLPVDTGNSSALRLEVSQAGAKLVATVCFERVRTPLPPRAREGLRLPHPSRWQVDADSARVTWSGNILSVHAEEPVGKYIVRSYSFPCRVNAMHDIPCRVVVQQGALGIGILSQDAAHWLQQYSFTPESSGSTIRIATGSNQSVQVVLYALREGILDAQIDWGDNLEPLPPFRERAIDTGILLPPHQDCWLASKPGVRFQWDGARLALRGDAEGGPYLVQSTSIPTVRIPRFEHRLSATVEVSSGCLGIGITTSDGGGFLVWRTYGPGMHDVVLPLQPLACERVAIVLFAATSEVTDAVVDWRHLATEPLPDTSAALIPEDADTKRIHHSATPSATFAPVPTTLVGRIRRILEQEGRRMFVARLAHRFGVRWCWAFFGIARRLVRSIRFRLRRALARVVLALARRGQANTTVYCAKPWTDLNNFTVDGRMDVCCIATGSSQEAYALGNIFHDDFQSIWNGERMREFRRTVNGTNKLPPCARCPMAAPPSDPIAY